MFGLKNKARNKAIRFHAAMKSYLTPVFARLGEKLRLRQRIRLANIMAKRYPKKMMACYLTFAVTLLAITLVMDFFSIRDGSQDTLDLKSIPSMSHRLQSLNNTEIQNERIRQELNRLGLKGMEVYNELDSLIRLPVKTHEDSLKIIQNYNILTKTFNSNGPKL